jgi:nicotinamidase-related amidase
MRLPRDATLIVIDVQQATEAPSSGARNDPDAESATAALIAVWREEALPIVHVHEASAEPGSGGRPGREARPLDGEIVVGRTAPNAFAGTPLEETLDALGATTLVVCGARAHNALEATARHAGSLGYRVFVVADACRAADEGGRPRSLGHLEREGVVVVDCARTLVAARLARAHERAKQARGQ